MGLKDPSEGSNGEYFRDLGVQVFGSRDPN